MFLPIVFIRDAYFLLFLTRIRRAIRYVILSAVDFRRQISLVVNLIVQLLLGVPLEMVYRGRKVMAIYFSGILANSLATSVTNPSAWLAGASGGVYALIAAHVATVIIVSLCSNLYNNTVRVCQ